jgi:hypothetical protein
LQAWAEGKQPEDPSLEGRSYFSSKIQWRLMLTRRKVFRVSFAGMNAAVVFLS